MISAVFLTVAAVGCLYLVGAAFSIPSRRRLSPAASPAVTLLKPLHGDEPNLYHDLAALCVQDYAGPVKIVCGVQHPSDAAIGVVERLKAAFPNADIELVVDGARHGANLKVANLINMARHARHDFIVLADSDIGVERDYLKTITATLAQPGVGAVTCFYIGVGATGFWSKLSALAVNTHFLPNAAVGLRTGLAHPCFGSTIALNRETLANIGGFEAFADHLADDYAMGDAVRAAGLRVEAAPMLVAHSCAETSFADLWSHEMRWARTIRAIDPLGYAGSILTHPLPWALVAAATGAPRGGASLALIAMVIRIVLLRLATR
ncbi:MAG: bacteriohopanetetrol glucosamine biosynthesis glycosyltransferase HpnI, partial [Hyphomicrobiales bacterium]|nr:bacteriohopanetetrol glucosamine biosynthesis glycosyltransferase HpnI [Hyphomicrobiales bacterium]